MMDNGNVVLLPCQEALMIQQKFTLHCAQRIYELDFTSKKAMSQALDIPYRSLLRVFNSQSYPGDVQRTMNAIATYCMEQRIPPEELFAGCIPIT